MPIDLSHDTISKLFYEQVKKLSTKNPHDSFDLQFSDKYF